MTKSVSHSRHPERSRRISRNYIKAFATGFLDSARNDEHLLRHSSFVISFVIRHSSFVIRLMETLRSISELSRLQGPLFLAIGVFDGVHLGHQAVISTSAEHARAVNGTPVVVTFDPHPEKILRPDKAPHLLTATPHKIALIRALGVRHLLIISFDKHFAATEPEDFVQQLVQHSKPLREICVGHEWSFGRNRRGNLQLLEKLGAQFDFNVVGIPPVTVNGELVSSTTIRRAIEAWRSKKSSDHAWPRIHDPGNSCAWR